jgi:hypothetical protein
MRGMRGVLWSHELVLWCVLWYILWYILGS